MSKFVPPSKVYVAGEEGSPLKSRTGQPVRIEEIRRSYNRANPWTDLDFPADASSVGGEMTGDAARGDGGGLGGLDLGGLDLSGLNLSGGRGLALSNFLGNMGKVLSKDPRDFSWERPELFCSKQHPPVKPQFAVAQDGLSAQKCSEYDVSQGTCLGDCWYVQALQGLCTKPDVLDFVIPADNFTGFDEGNYCGAFHFRFYYVTENKWVDIVVDDRLPIRPNGEPAMAGIINQRDSSVAEFWVALIEKAYAKMYGSYKGIDGGLGQQALVDFTGGFGELIPLNPVPGDKNTAQWDTHGLTGASADSISSPHKAVARFIQTYIKGDAFLNLCSYDPSHVGFQTAADAYQLSEYGPPGLGLRPTHGYSILDLQELNYKPSTGMQGSVTLVKVKNPWGHGEWTGAYSDTDDIHWNLVEKDLRSRDNKGSTLIDEGAFWMDLRDMILYFENLEITHYGLTDGTKLAIAKGGWSPSVVRMGSITDWIDLLRYTAFKFEVKQGPEAAKYSDKSGGKALVCYSVSLEGYNSIWQKQGIQFQARLFRIDSPNDTLKDIVTRGQQLDGPNNLGCRDANGYRFVDPGTYILIPQINSSKNPEYNNKPINFTVREKWSLVHFGAGIDPDPFYHPQDRRR